jgi:hypothetical protein
MRNHLNFPLSVKSKPHILESNIEYFAASNSQHFFPYGVYFSTKYKTAPCHIEYGIPVSKDIVTFLEERGELISENTIIPSESPSSSGYYDVTNGWDESEAEQNKLFFYKDCLVALQRTHSRKVKAEKVNYKMSVFYSASHEPPLDELESFLIEENLKNVIFTIMRDEHGSVRFEPFEVSVPESYSVEKCYNEDFLKVHDVIISSLNKNESGLYLFHGDPGTGKTTYIKHLSSLIKRDIIYVPTGFIEYLADPSFLPALLNKKHSVLVIEDAEKALLSRDPSDASSIVSAVLNITDGIMANVFNIAIIATYNSSRQSIDKALLRKGRLKVEYCFGKLSQDKAQKIASELQENYEIDGPITLADLYNFQEDSTIISSEILEEKRMGFR